MPDEPRVNAPAPPPVPIKDVVVQIAGTREQVYARLAHLGYRERRGDLLAVDVERLQCDAEGWTTSARVRIRYLSRTRGE